jgi:hypothetical protein
MLKKALITSFMIVLASLAYKKFYIYEDTNDNLSINIENGSNAQKDSPVLFSKEGLMNNNDKRLLLAILGIKAIFL